MSGNYSRKLYDDCFQTELVQSSKGEGIYRVHVDQKSNAPSYIPESIVSNRDNMFNPYNGNAVGNLVNIESHLKRMDLADSNCQEGRTLVEMGMYGQYLKSKIPNVKKVGSTKLNTDYSRMNNPAMDVRSMTTSRFDFPIEDPRSSAFFGFAGTEQDGDMRFGVNSRLDARDMDMADYYTKLDRGIQEF
jgi:hypothetical protein